MSGLGNRGPFEEVDPYEALKCKRSRPQNVHERQISTDIAAGAFPELANSPLTTEISSAA